MMMRSNVNMSWSPTPSCSWIVTAAILLQPIVLLASGDAAHGEEHPGMPTAVKLVIMTINLGIFLALLRWAALPMMKEWVAGRRGAVVGALEKAAIATREAETLAQEWKDRLARLDQEIAELRAQAQKQIDGEREQILEAARRLAEHIRRDAERAAEQELRNARESLRAEVATQAFRIARESAPSQLGSGDHKRFVDEFVSQVSK